MTAPPLPAASSFSEMDFKCAVIHHDGAPLQRPDANCYITMFVETNELHRGPTHWQQNTSGCWRRFVCVFEIRSPEGGSFQSRRVEAFVSVVAVCRSILNI